MRASGAAVWLSVLAVVVLSVASGPLVAGVDFTAEDTESQSAPERALGSGNATVTDVSLDLDGIRLERGDYGSQTYYLQVPDATVDLQSVTGQPILAYKIRIPALGIERSSSAFLDESYTEDGPTTLALSLDDGPVEPGRVTQSSYEAEVSVLLRSQSGTRVLRQVSVTVEVRE
ncbi:hypothetical protein AUR64_14635 [Haloprofundus marisrubri]|uniref:Uncharacterized protein n=1 Tax=Haloprofundus marisrubri TaxID=1514971 RepID=A0A0W1R750_9EURY|nr:hypothetical protein [Haloprofundus marisrubri]KTG09036.1 hypothetical protein AUR64_14635 [Haloprofundus marisrubri]